MDPALKALLRDMLLAQRGHPGWRNECPLSGVKRTFTAAIPGPSGVLV